jgi:conjugal transfer/type IV secretion protein DotA/TraY
MSQKTEISTVFQKINAKSVAKYALLPGIIPRLRGLSRAIDGFLFMFTQLFGACGLIPRNHPCLMVANIGKYRFIDIVGLAASNVVFDKKHISQTIMFFVIIGTLIISIATAAAGIGVIILHVPDAHAQLFGDSMDKDYNKQQDWAYQFLGEVFGPAGPSSLWGGNGATAPQHEILRPIMEAMFRTYSEALLVIAAFMVIYLIITMVADAARTGQPFGSNFNSVWAPIRLAVAIGLLVPVSSGYNGAQLVAFQVANWGSALATNVWVAGLNSIDGDGKKFLAMSQPSDGYRFMRGLFLMNVCVEAVNQINMQGQLGGKLKAVFRNVADGNDKYSNTDASIVDMGGLATAVIPGINGIVLNTDYCGQYKVPEIFKPVDVGIEGVAEPVPAPPGTTETLQIQKPSKVGALPNLISSSYQTAVSQMQPIFQKSANLIVQARMCVKDKSITDYVLEAGSDNQIVAHMHSDMLKTYRDALGFQCSDPADLKSCTYLSGKGFNDAAVADGTSIVNILKTGKQYGWASAGSFMLVLSYINGLMSSAVNSPPDITGMPRPMTNPVSSPTKRNATVDETGFLENIWNSLFGGSSRKEDVAKINKILWEANTWFVDWPSDPNSDVYQSTDATEKIDIATWRGDLNDESAREQFNGGGQASPLDGVFGSFTRGLIVINQNDVNPLAKVVSIGSSLFYVAAAITTAGLIANIWLSGMFSLALSIALPLTITAYLLAVVLPASLFFNFLFAVIEWVVSVFEAVLGMPLWALSFISIGGEGIGDKAMAGVMMLFEIMLRPTIIVIVTVASLIIFSASVHFFNKAFALYYRSYMLNADFGGSVLMSIGSLFMYVMAVHSIGNSSFKLIPTIANNFMRWIGGPNGFSGTMQFDMDKVSGIAGLMAAQNIANNVGSTVGGMMDKGGMNWNQRTQKKVDDKKIGEMTRIADKQARGQPLTKSEQRLQTQMERAGTGAPAGASKAQRVAAKLRQSKSEKDLL